jgi:hypothetical protein
VACNPEIDAEKNLNEKITRNPGSSLVAELNGEAVGNVLIMEDGWGHSFLGWQLPKIIAISELEDPGPAA